MQYKTLFTKPRNTKFMNGTLKITTVGAALNNTNKNLNLGSSVTRLFNTDLRFTQQFSVMLNVSMGAGTG